MQQTYLFILLATLAAAHTQGCSHADSTPVLAEIYLEGDAERQPGEGSCGSPPWGVDHIDGGDFRCPPPKYWFGYKLKATAHYRFHLEPNADGTWQIKGNPEKPGVLNYQTAEQWSDGQRVCQPVSTTAENFPMEVTGVASKDKVELHFKTSPVESSQWRCDNGHSYQRDTTSLLLNWSVAMSGKHMDLSATLGAADLGLPGQYEREYQASMNPSPQNRDHARVTVAFTCLQPQGDGSDKAIACPWE